MSEPGPSQTSKDAAKLAGGSGIVLAGGLVDRGLRAVLSWYLSGALGSAAFGLYTTVIAALSVTTVFSTLGLDTGVVFFGARHQRAGDKAKFKGILLAGLVLSVIAGLLVAALVALAGSRGWVYRDIPAVGKGLVVAAPAVAVWTLLMFLVGALRAVKDMRSSTLAYQIGLPVALIGTAGAGVWAGGGLEGVLVAFIAANVLSLAAAAGYSWRRFGKLLRDRTVPATYNLGELLSYSVPQSLAAGLFRVNLWMDILMITWLAGEAETGIYKIASTLALLGSVTVTAVTTMFNPMVSELVSTRELDRLNALLKIVTRWLTILSLPLYLVLILVPDAVLLIYDEAYLAAALPIQILIVGQFFQVSLAPANRLIPMAGHARLNLINAVVAAVLNFALNWFWIPIYGSTGAAAASAVTFALWSLWRVAEVWWMYRCFPYSTRTLLFLAGSFALLGLGWAVPAALELDLWGRVGACGLTLLAYAALVWFVGRAPEDSEVAGPAMARLKKKLGR